MCFIGEPIHSTACRLLFEVGPAHLFMTNHVTVVISFEYGCNGYEFVIFKKFKAFNRRKIITLVM